MRRLTRALAGLTLLLGGAALAEDEATPGADGDPVQPAPAAAPTVQPDRLTIRRDPGGDVTLEGALSDAEAEAGLVAQARRVAGNAMVTTRLLLEPESGHPDREALARAALEALAVLEQGVAVIAPEALSLQGEAEDDDARDAAVEALEDAPWQIELTLRLPMADPYKFEATKTGGDLIYEGNAPNEDTAAVLEAIVADAAGATAEGTLSLAHGMPGEDWPDLVRAGLGALMLASSGTLEIAGTDVSLSADLPDAGSKRRLTEKLQPGWRVDLTIVDPSPDPELNLTVGVDGKLAARGRLPGSIGADKLVDMLGPVDTSAGLSATAYGKTDTWQKALDALAIAVPRMASGEVYMTDRLARFQGALKPGFDAAGLSAALRATLGTDWEIGITLEESPPPSRLDISRTPEGLDVDGIVPDGVTSERIQALLGEADTSDLGRGGEGDREEWERKIRLAGQALNAFETGRARLEGRSVEMSGTLTPGHGADEVGDWLQAKLGKGWTVSVTAEDSPASEGARRVDLETGEAEVLHRGRWQPVYEFPASVDVCATKLDEAGAGDAVTFVPGGTDIDGGHERLLDRLAGVARHCLKADTLSLYVEGHTDDRGDADENLLLSEARALAVVLALTERGVPAEKLHAVGFGESRPVADNETEEGRARNRRIEFRWEG